MTAKTKPSPTYSTGAQILTAALRRQAADEPDQVLKAAKMTFADKADVALTKKA